MTAVVNPPKSAMDTPAAREPRNCKRLAIDAVKIPSGIAAPNCRNAHTHGRWPRLEERGNRIS
jgi:hypothetical protein